MRRNDLRQERPDLTTREQTRRMEAEWKTLSPEERIPFETETDETSPQAVGVEEFMSRVKRERKKQEVDPEFEEDEILLIVNHKEKWKLTYGKGRKKAKIYVGIPFTAYTVIIIATGHFSPPPTF